MDERFDVVVVGGGPGGMMAAGRAAERGRRVLLLEKNPALGEKLKLTGGGRCNITHAEFDPRAFLAHFGEGAKYLFSPFSRFGVAETFDFFEGLGLPLEVEELARAFPRSRRATDVVQALEKYLRAGGVAVRTGSAVRGIRLEEDRVAGVETERGVVRAASVVLATGGCSYPKTGSTGDGLAWLRELGHTVHAPAPDLVPLRVGEQWVRDLSGTTLEGMRIVFSAAGEPPVVREGSLLFTHFGLSGPLVLNCSREVRELLRKGAVSARIDLFPGLDAPQLDRRVLEVFGGNRNKTVGNALRLLVPGGMARAVAANLPEGLAGRRVNALPRTERATLVRLLKGLPLTVTGTMGYDWAIVSGGGADLSEIETRTMASRIYPNLFVVGDLLHVRRPSGGFSLQLCWTTGWVAGDSA